MSIVLAEGPNELNIQMVAIPPAVASLNGVVTDAETGQPIQGVKVTLDGQVTYTDSQGSYSFGGLTPGNYTVRFEKSGYQTVTY